MSEVAKQQQEQMSMQQAAVTIQGRIFGAVNEFVQLVDQSDKIIKGLQRMAREQKATIDELNKTVDALKKDLADTGAIKKDADPKKTDG